MSKRDEIDQLLYKYMPIADEELIRELEQRACGHFFRLPHPYSFCNLEGSALRVLP